MKRVTGLGGIFFKSSDPKKSKEWYEKHLGFNTDDYGTRFRWRENGNSEKIAHTVWSPFKKDTNYFSPSEKEFMINFRVDNIEELVKALKEEGVQILDDIETYEYGKFVHIMDNDGNKIELWQAPIDETSESVDGGEKGITF